MTSFVHWFIFTVFYPFYRIFFFREKNCWRVSIKTANRLGIDQISNATESDRYPEIFGFVQKLKGEKSKIRILSFGCSYGLECNSLHNYFPNACITGYDIFEENIERAKKTIQNKNITFTAKWENVEKGLYDVVFAMTVFCRTPHTCNKKDCSKIYSFEKFNAQMLTLDTIIQKGGLLVLYNANFLFTETSVSHRYEAISIPGFSDSGVVPKFGKDNKLLKNQDYFFSLFRKL